MTLPVTIRDNTAKQWFTMAKTYRILKSRVKAVSKITLSNDANDLSHLPGNLKDLKKFDLKSFVRVRGELQFTQTFQHCEEIIARFRLKMANEYLTNTKLEVELL